MDDMQKKRINTIILLAVLEFVVLAIVSYLLGIAGFESFKWSEVIGSWGALMYISMAYGTVYGVSYAKYLYKIGLPILLLINLVCGVMGWGFTWMALLIAVIYTAVCVLVIWIVNKVIIMKKGGGRAECDK